MPVTTEEYRLKRALTHSKVDIVTGCWHAVGSSARPVDTRHEIRVVLFKAFRDTPQGDVRAACGDPTCVSPFHCEECSGTEGLAVEKALAQADARGNEKAKLDIANVAPPKAAPTKRDENPYPVARDDGR